MNRCIAEKIDCGVKVSGILFNLFQKVIPVVFFEIHYRKDAGEQDEKAMGNPAIGIHGKQHGDRKRQRELNQHQEKAKSPELSFGIPKATHKKLEKSKKERRKQEQTTEQ